jgi:hypothetical protein
LLVVLSELSKVSSIAQLRTSTRCEFSDGFSGIFLQEVRAAFSSGIKKAAANAAAKVRRWIKELQINVSEHRGDEPGMPESSEICCQSLQRLSVAGFALYGVSVTARSEYGVACAGKTAISDMHCYGACNSRERSDDA